MIGRQNIIHTDVSLHSPGGEDSCLAYRSVFVIRAWDKLQLRGGSRTLIEHIMFPMSPLVGPLGRICLITQICMALLE